MHTSHPDVHEHGLQDGCPRCADHANHPMRDLDDEMLGSLVALAVNPDRFTVGRSETELVAAAKVLTALEHAGHLAEVAPDAVAGYLRDRWRLEATIENPRAAELAALRARLEAPDA
jgi:hypothetical protein